MVKIQKLRKRLFEIIEKGSDKDIPSKVFDYFIIILIILNIISVILESFYSLYQHHVRFFSGFEKVSVIIFTIEYFLRLWTASLRYPHSRHPYLRHSVSFMALIDLFAILPFYLPFFIPFDLRFIRILRLIRLLRIFKLNRYSDSMVMIGNVLKKEKDILLTTVFFTFILLLLASSLMYYIETEAQPEQFPNIIASLWWAVATLTTVGYGDVYPITTLGKFLSAIIAILGIGLVALPTGILSSGFINEINKKKRPDHKRCPHCGKTIDS